MCIDVEVITHMNCTNVQSGIIYMLGGWNGTTDLADFWAFDIRGNRWTCLSPDTRKFEHVFSHVFCRCGGPGPRSCHKICFNIKSRTIFVLGRYIDPQNRPNGNCESDFFLYDTMQNTWTLLSSNTAVCLIYFMSYEDRLTAVPN